MFHLFRSIALRGDILFNWSQLHQLYQWYQLWLSFSMKPEQLGCFSFLCFSTSNLDKALNLQWLQENVWVLLWASNSDWTETFWNNERKINDGRHFHYAWTLMAKNWPLWSTKIIQKNNYRYVLSNDVKIHFGPLEMSQYLVLAEIAQVFFRRLDGSISIYGSAGEDNVSHCWKWTRLIFPWVWAWLQENFNSINFLFGFQF